MDKKATQIIFFPVEINEELGVNENGETFCSIRGAARIVGVSDVALVKHFKTANYNESKLCQLLVNNGFAPANFSQNGIHDTALTLIIEYYALDAGARCTEQAKNVYRAIANYGLRSLFHQLLGWQQKPKTQLEMLLESVQQMVEVEKRQLALENKQFQLEQDVNQLKTIQQQAEAELTALPVALLPAPEISTRAKINMIVRNYCQRTNLSHINVWNSLYKQLYYRCHYDAKARAKNSGRKCYLDQIEADGMIESLFSIASESLV